MGIMKVKEQQGREAQQVIWKVQKGRVAENWIKQQRGRETLVWVKKA